MIDEQTRTAPAASRGPGFGIAGPILSVIASFVVAGIVYAIMRGGGASARTAEIVAAVVGGVAILGFGLALRARLPAHQRRQVLRSKGSVVAGLAVGLALGLALRIPVGLIVAAGEQIDPSLCDDLLALDDDLPTVLWHKAALAVALVVLAPFGEELLFRGLLLRGLARRMRFSLAAVVSGVLFAVLHPQYWSIWPLLIGISLFGFVAAFVYRRWGYASSVTMHAVFNAIAAVALFVDFGEATC